MRGSSVLIAVLFLVPATAQTTPIPGLEDAITDGIDLDLDTPELQQRLREFSSSVDGEAIHDCVARLQEGVEGQFRMMGTPTQDLFVQAYQNVWGELGLPTALHHFDDAGPGILVSVPTGGTNIMGVLPGNDPNKWIVLGGHYDTREAASVGALDNGSGICTVHEIARAMKADTDANGPYDASVVFNWYDGEEWGLYGAVAFANDDSVARDLLGVGADEEVDVLVSQSYDMPGINYPAQNIWVQYDDGGDNQVAVLNLRTAPIHAENDWTCWSYGCYEELKDRPDFDEILRRNTNYQFLMREIAYDVMGLPPEFVWIYDDHYGRSDHIPLIAKGAAGNRIQGSHDEEYPCYHQPCDRLDWLYIQTGGRENLIQAYETEARVGGATAFYTALRGDHGHYGDVLWFDEDPAMYAPAAPDEEAAPTWIGVPVIGLLLAFAMRRQR